MLGEQTLTVTRRASGTWVDGIYHQGADSTFTITGSIQPYEPLDTSLLPEGMRTDQMQKLYTLTELYPVVLNANTDDDSDRVPDEISWNGQRWIVRRLSQFDEGIGQRLWHYKYLLEKIGKDEQ